MYAYLCRRDRPPDTALSSLWITALGAIALLTLHSRPFGSLHLERSPSWHCTWRDRSAKLKNRPTFTFHLILKNFSRSCKRTCIGDRSPDTALGAIALPRSKIAQLSPFTLYWKIFLDHVRAPAQAIVCVWVRIGAYTASNLISTVVDNHA